MTGPTPTPAPRNEGEYAKKLALAILSTLEQKGLLTQLEVDTILHAAHRAATPPPPAPPQPLGGPAILGTKWVKADAPQPAPAITAAPLPAGESVKVLPPEPSKTDQKKADEAPSEATKGAEEDRKGEAQPSEQNKPIHPVIDFSLE